MLTYTKSVCSSSIWSFYDRVTDLDGNRGVYLLLMIFRDNRYLGCAVDVLSLADQWCSGRQSCQIPIPNSALRRTQPCPKDIKSYFEASYRCQPGTVRYTNINTFLESPFNLPMGSYHIKST